MSKKVAYGGILLGINVILLTLTNIIPINTLFLMGLASLPISIIIMEWGPKMGTVFYMGSMVLSFIAMANKAQWILYVLTFGIYGLVKYIIEQNKSIYIEYILKIIFANIIILIAYSILKQFVYIPLNITIMLIFNIVFVIYDYVYSSFITLYNDKLHKIISIR